MYRDDLYRDPGLYDLEYAHQSDDVVFYAKAAARSGGPVLELGCGNGRITLPMARTGVEVVGIDLAEAMLHDLRGRLAAEPVAVQHRVTVRKADFLDLPEDPRYALVALPFNALHHCAAHPEVLALLAGVRRSLREGGRLVLDCYLPDPSLYQRDPRVRYEERSFAHPVTGEQLTSWERGWYDPLEQVHHVVYIYRHEDGHEHEVPVDFRMYYPRELEALIDWGGFRIVSQASDFRGTPLSAQAIKWVLVLEPR